MSTGNGEPPVEAKPKPPAGGPGTASEKPQNAPALPKPESQPKPGTTTPTGAPKLSNAELKAKAKAEKQARRAQAKASKEASQGGPVPPLSAGQPGPDTKGNKAKGKPDSAPSATPGGTGRATGTKGTVQVAPAKPEITLPECFGHLSLAKRLPTTQADKDVHPAVLALGQQMATFVIAESIERLQGTLLAFKRVSRTTRILLVVLPLIN
jgi:translation initiation factor eIF-2B subunit delta